MKKTYIKPDIQTYELGPEHAQICKQSYTSEANELRFRDEIGEDEQF